MARRVGDMQIVGRRSTSRFRNLFVYVVISSCIRFVYVRNATVYRSRIPALVGSCNCSCGVDLYTISASNVDK